MRIAVVPGDGIGPEVTREALKVLGALEPVEVSLFPWSADHFLKTGETVPAGVFDKLARVIRAVA